MNRPAASSLDRILSRVTVDPVQGFISVDDAAPIQDDTPRIQQVVTDELYRAFHAGNSHNGQADHRDAWLEEQLTQRTPHLHTRAQAKVRESASDADAVVEVDGVRIHARLPEPSPGTTGSRVDEYVEILLPTQRPRLSPGFFLVDGAVGRPRSEALLRVYAHVAAAPVATELWESALLHLESLRVPYRAKITSSRCFLPRLDGLVIYLGAEHQHVVPAVSQVLLRYQESNSPTSLYTKPLGPGVSIGWEPTDSRKQPARMSFGEHRSAAIASGLISYMRENGKLRLADYLQDALVQANIDPSALYRNMDSPA